MFPGAHLLTNNKITETYYDFLSALNANIKNMLPNSTKHGTVLNFLLPTSN